MEVGYLEVDYDVDEQYGSGGVWYTCMHRYILVVRVMVKGCIDEKREKVVVVPRMYAKRPSAGVVASSSRVCVCVCVFGVHFSFVPRREASESTGTARGDRHPKGEDW
jgi:hypothetical protein